MPAEVRSGESSIRQFAVDFLERKRPELLAILADKDLHSDLLKETPAKIKLGARRATSLAPNIFTQIHMNE